MKTCKIVFPRVLQTEERPDNISSPEQAKVKITSALLTAVEYAAYRGDEDLKYPLVPGRFAVGIVVEAGENCCAVEKARASISTASMPAGRTRKKNCALRAPTATDSCATLSLRTKKNFPLSLRR